MKGIKLDHVSLHLIDLRGLNLADSSIKKAGLDIVYLTDANMSHADLAGTRLSQVELTGADLTGANLKDISYDQFTLYSLSKARLDGAQMSDQLKADINALNSGALSPATDKGAPSNSIK
ncbi:Pentapeptide repeats (8 copies) [uncultured archaeon]|nr:Pentapeptide repeats (8 copies) [uncultured archaeon]